MFSEGFMLNKDLRQGSSLSPTLFKVNLNEPLKLWQTSCSDRGIQMKDDTNLNFSGDHIAISHDRDNLEFMGKTLITKTRSRRNSLGCVHTRQVKKEIQRDSK